MAADRRRRFGSFDDDAVDFADVDDPDAGGGAVFGRGTAPNEPDVDPDLDADVTTGDDLRVARRGPWSRYVHTDDLAATGPVVAARDVLRSRRARALESAFVEVGIDTDRPDAARCDVADVLFEDAGCSAVVQGPGAAVNVAGIRFRAFDDATWHRLADVFAASAATGAALLDGRMPDDADALAAVVDRRFVPDADEVTDPSCSCGAPPSTCVHVAVLAAAVVRRVDDDPLVLFGLRGMPAEAFFAALRERRRVFVDPATTTDGTPAVVADAVSADPVRFWSAGPLPPPALPSPPRGDAAAVLDDEPVTVVVGSGRTGDVSFDDLVRGAYPGIRRGAMARLRRTGGTTG